MTLADAVPFIFLCVPFFVILIYFIKIFTIMEKKRKFVPATVFSVFCLLSDCC